MLFSILAILVFTIGLFIVFSSDSKKKLLLLFLINGVLSVYIWYKEFLILSVFNFTISLLPFNNFFLFVKKKKDWNIRRDYKNKNIQKIIAIALIMFVTAMIFTKQDIHLLNKPSFKVVEDLFLSVFILLFLIIPIGRAKK